MQTILNFQRQFFLTEDEATIRPMVLREVADASGLDLSVVSRATQGKYVSTRRGVYPLKMFFNERRNKELPAETEDDNTVHRIIASLREQGFDIARRTVAKYREKLGFPVGRLRKTL